MRLFGRRPKKVAREFDPDHTFLESENSPDFDFASLEGRIVSPIRLRSLYFFASFATLVFLVFVIRVFSLQIVEGDKFLSIAEQNATDEQIIFADRGVIFDRNGVELAWNLPKNEGRDFPARAYIADGGFGHLLGYVKYPAQDAKGKYWREFYEGSYGVEEYCNENLNGENGSILTEKSAQGEEALSQKEVPKVDGENVEVTIDANLQKALSKAIQGVADEGGYRAGVGLVMDVKTGELLAMTSYPEFSPNDFVSEDLDSNFVQSLFTDPKTPFLNRAVQGLYSPGSIVKPFIAFAALREGIIDGDTKVLSTGSISVQSPYDPDVVSIFRDWRKEGHGPTDVRFAIADSVNTFFYAIGGGYKDQPGLGITRIASYLKSFSIGQKTGFQLGGEVEGVVPTPDWKAQIFDGDIWRLGDTYNTSIGQYGFQVTPMQMVRAVGALASMGTLHTPYIVKTDCGKDFSPSPASLPFLLDEQSVQPVMEGMRMVVTEGTGRTVNLEGSEIAAKTGTAQTGPGKKFINSWTMGFFPYEEPEYAFVVLMERAPVDTAFSASVVLRRAMEEMRGYEESYFFKEETIESPSATDN